MMGFVSPQQVFEDMIQAGEAKAKLPIKDLLIRGGLAGALHGFGTTLAYTAEGQTGLGSLGPYYFQLPLLLLFY
jgi:formate transporter